MISARRASVILLQPPISDRVRKQPRQRLEAPSTMQVLTHGEAMVPGVGSGVWVTVDDMIAKYDPVPE